uniref:Transporter n=1 Tax=Arion vulgaris TaxID=1028688 RepID=A0A0B7AU17_9EUPU
MAEPTEEDNRPSWGRHLEFVVTCIGFAVGLGNVWRFPHLAYKNGGGAFLIPYFVSLIFMGIPLFCLELLFGQFASMGPIAIWEINPLFKGLGYTMVMLAAIISIYYNIIVAIAIFYFFASMQSTVPWSTCGNDWNTCFCRTSDMNITLEDPLMWKNSSGLDCTGIIFNRTDIKSSSQEYYYNYVLEASDGIFNSGKVKWDLTLCNLLSWVIICACLIKGVQSMGKAVYFFALFPYVLMTVLLVRGVTLTGASKGIDFYLSPDTSKLLEAKVWKDAASQIFFSLSCCTGSLTAMSSYNKFNNNVLRDSIIIPIINCLTSFYVGFAIFSVLGFMSVNTGVDVKDVTTDGTGLVFVAYPEALSEMPVPQIWSVLFFLMMICLGMGTQFPSVETVLTALQDEFRIFRQKKTAIVFRISVCVLGFLLGLPMTTQGGNYLLELCNTFVGFPLLLVGFLEFLAIIWVYGIKRFSEDVLLIVGTSYTTRVLFYCYYIWSWVVIAPIFILGIIIFEIVEYKPITSDQYPGFAEGLGWLIVAGIMVWTPLWYVARFLVEWSRENWKNGFKLFIKMNQPTIKWGPKLPENRTLPRYQLYNAPVVEKTIASEGHVDISIQQKPPAYHREHTHPDVSDGYTNLGFISDTPKQVTKL